MAFLWLCLFPLTGVCFDVTARVDKQKISMEDAVFLTIAVSGRNAEPDLSMIRDFSVMSRGSSSRYQSINGRSEIKAEYQYVLTPLKKGTLTIPAIKVVMDGQISFTTPIVIHVSDNLAGPDDTKPLFAVSEVSKTKLFVGEQAIFSLKFFTSKRLSGLGFEKPPEFNGMASRPFEKEKSYSQTINGIAYHVTQVDYVIIPAGPGTVRVDPAVLIARVVVESKQNFPFDSFFSTNHYTPVRVMSNPVTLVVDPVPPYPGKDQFSGLLGRFEITAACDKKNLKAGESATLTLKITGRGNIMDAMLPPMALDPDVFKVYDDTPSETIHLTETGYEGFKVFKKALVPVKPGRFLIPRVSLVYFDVDQKQFKQVSTPDIFLDVAPSQEMTIAAQPLIGATDNPIVKKEVSLVNQDILEIKEDLSALENWQEMDLLLFALLLSFPAILFSGLKLFIMVSKKDLSNEKIMIEKAKFHLKKACQKTSQDAEFLGHLYSSLVAQVFSKQGKKGETITIQEARTILAGAHVDEMLIEKVIHLLETIESVRFGGREIDSDKAKTLLEKTKQTIKLLCLAMVCLTIFSSVPQNAMASDAAVFLEGIKNYKQGDFKQAAINFEAVANNNIKNPYLFYNIANAFLKADDIGHAVLWYERAKQFIPNDPDLRFNLAHANTRVTDKPEEAIHLMDILFFWDRVVAPKTLQVTALFCSVVFFAWASIRVVKKQIVFSGTGIVLFSVLILITAITLMTYYKKTADMAAVIVQEEVAVRSGMTDTSTKLFDLHAGTRVSVEEIKNGYLKILFSKNKIGWVKAGQAIII